jgi:hypothetical protein
MAMIAGVGRKTLFRMEYRSGLGSIWKEMNKITDRVAGDPDREGDGRVPLTSAQLENVGALRYVEGTHGDLPNLPAVSADVFRWLRGESMQLPDIPEQALGDHLGVETEAGGEDPGYLAALEDEPTEDELEAIDAQLEAGLRPEFIHAKLL